MMQYSRLGLYVERKKKEKIRPQDKVKKIDWINVALFILLFVVVLMFLLVK